MQDSGHDGIKVFVGVDVAKRDHYACAVSTTGAEVLARAVPNDETAIRCLIDDAATHGAVVLVIDTTSSAASLLMETAAQRQVPVAYVTGLAMRAAAGLYAGVAKTDPKDALVLADYARRNADRLSWTQPSDELLAKLRIFNARDTDLAADATRTINRLRDALLAVSPALERAIGNKLASSPGLRDALASWSTPTALKTAGSNRIRDRVAERSPRTAKRLTEAICSALNAQTITVTAETAWADAIRDLACDLNRVCEHRKQLGTHIEAAFMEHLLAKILTSMCGFGPRTGARTLAEIGDPHRFTNGSHLASYAGLAPVDWQSGSSATTRKPRGGNHRLKNAMFQAAFVAARHDPDAHAYYQQKRAEGKRHNEAVICVAPQTLQHHLSHAQNPNPLPTTQPPKPHQTIKKHPTTRQGHPPFVKCFRRNVVNRRTLFSMSFSAKHPNSQVTGPLGRVAQAPNPHQ